MQDIGIPASRLDRREWLASAPDYRPMALSLSHPLQRCHQACSHKARDRRCRGVVRSARLPSVRRSRRARSDQGGMRQRSISPTGLTAQFVPSTHAVQTEAHCWSVSTMLAWTPRVSRTDHPDPDGITVGAAALALLLGVTQKVRKASKNPREIGRRIGQKWSRISQRTSATERSMSSAKERPIRAVDGSVVGTKKEEKQNFRVRFLHTTSRKWLVLLKCPSHPSLVLWLF